MATTETTDRVKCGVPGVIRIDEAYTMAEFCKRMGIGNTVYRHIRRNGLKVIQVGKKRYVRGSDWMAYLDRVAVNQPAIVI